MEDPIQPVWILKASVADRSGALTSIASAFSNQGINLDAILGGAQKNRPSHGSVIVAFHGTKQEKNIMFRRLERLQKVDEVEWIKEPHEDLKQALFDLATHLESY